ncbi:hypothetical protein KY328_05115 [Candidatus Woesearchaeota archaeon]|nr:hypothetical protein [Candidatus Woesearchaeota archaeon]MBW3022279.1 hypothetical protein [Candidatus Woesearchaeota archaeon]
MAMYDPQTATIQQRIERERKLEDTMSRAGHIEMAEVHRENCLRALADDYSRMGNDSKAAKFRKEADSLRTGFYSHV